MSDARYRQALRRAVEDLDEKVEQAKRVQAAIVALQATVKSLLPLVPGSDPAVEKARLLLNTKGAQRVNLSAEVRDVVRDANQWISVAAILESLQARGFDFAAYANVRSVVYRTLDALASKDLVLIRKKDGVTHYRWKASSSRE
jgi:hypothetical protein